MSNPFLAVAIYIILWWLSFFMLLPVGAQSFHESGEAAPPGVDPGAPRLHRLGLKAAAAAGIAAVLWLGVAWGISVNLLRVAPPA